uniref:Uncharacterized protein n=1 Tax=Oxyrrhis marina TaxID=2969 RepID=A0A7S3UQE1_OXYMA
MPHKGKTRNKLLSQNGYDSLVCVEFTDDLVNAGIAEGTTPLLPKDPVAKAKARIWVDYFNKNVASNFYKVLVPRDQETRVQGMENFRAALRKFQENMKGPFFLRVSTTCGYGAENRHRNAPTTTLRHTEPSLGTQTSSQRPGTPLARCRSRSAILTADKR